MVLMSDVSKDLFERQLAIITICLVGSYLIIVIYLYFYFSGTPFRSPTYAQKMKRLAIIFGIWTICMIPKASLTLSGYQYVSNDQSDQNSNDQNDLKTAILTFLAYLMTEILPIVLTLEANFLQIFTLEFKVLDDNQNNLQGETLLEQTIGFQQNMSNSGQSIMDIDVERGGDINNQDEIFQLQLERGKSFMDISKQRQVLEEQSIKINQDDLSKTRDKLLVGKKDFVLFEVMVKKQKEFDRENGLQVLIGDIEINPFQKYASLMTNYSVSSVWEILHDQAPFDNDLLLAKNFVLNEDARPQISDTVDVDIAKLIRLCWQNDPNKRPHFSLIYAKLREN
ncbi:tkl family protein kinase [Stylonychia lemnae]|uniref:Tkl family protein kinase n=1 Tax=Stylonychia lemnae TaxID=5949 RepID=A0A078A879_STYLE|nr:tkl family protein kinase [Stylonychia lemnae]|eukprot:CDW78465.1 tkl family protein kinase [Stylonychia lemnae]